MSKEYDSRNVELGQLIEELFQIKCESEFEEVCNKLDEIYLDVNGELRDNFRHEYTNISGKIRELVEYEEEGIKPFNLQNLIDNVGYLYDYALQHDKKYIKNLFKLKDHIGLEAGRIELVEQLKWEITNSKESVTIQLNDLHKIADELGIQINDSTKLVSTLTEQSEKIEEKLKVLDEMSDIVKEKMEDVHRDSITILGIFASIVLSFTAGVGFSSSVLENFHQGSPYRVMAVIIGLAMILMNAIGILMMYIEKIKSIREKEIKYPTILLGLDCACILLLCIDFIAFKFKWFN